MIFLFALIKIYICPWKWLGLWYHLQRFFCVLFMYKKKEKVHRRLVVVCPWPIVYLIRPTLLLLPLDFLLCVSCVCNAWSEQTGFCMHLSILVVVEFMLIHSEMLMRSSSYNKFIVPRRPWWKSFFLHHQLPWFFQIDYSFSFLLKDESWIIKSCLLFYSSRVARKMDEGWMDGEEFIFLILRKTCSACVSPLLLLAPGQFISISIETNHHRTAAAAPYCVAP